MGKNFEKKIRIGIIGFGTVGCGTAKILLENRENILKKTGLDLELVKVADLDITTPREIELPAGMLTDNTNEIIEDDSIDLGIELIGGTTAAKTIIEKLLKKGKGVVTANKALLAKHGIELFRLARENETFISYEASCAGGIPIVLALRSGLAANNIEGIYGILNGTCNFILTSMAVENKDFPVALKEAQEKGYAEADPTLDINGGDSGHKIAILASIAFGYEISFDDVRVSGIENISIQDINYGLEMGYVLKLLAVAQRDAGDGISLRVMPAFISKTDQLAGVSGPFNAVSVFGDAVGQTMYYGRGAGMMPTASAIIADVIEAGLGNAKRSFEAMKLRSREEFLEHRADPDEIESRFYIRLLALDKPGVFSKLSEVLGKNGISISGALQHEGRGPNNTVPVIITTHLTKLSAINKSIEQIQSLSVIEGCPTCIQIAELPEDTD
ncbi:Homoserine dehydrogenase [Limihaloglobus sulfuriphilus]|uniref:Homoserine dehydrogenase n=1 Tax=Limihaloglobus sulfuriphilus TaxID=1851148 RepID=A0A1Q2MFG9_9BACT|nr:homoserine dehydrogenase [Limihaloglobus sulfuriphilus]AQQ71298.1 Homoserine dehydrogenase [Limihaloglobus sulfuriphilus]